MQSRPAAVSRPNSPRLSRVGGVTSPGPSPASLRRSRADPPGLVRAGSAPCGPAGMAGVARRMLISRHTHHGSSTSPDSPIRRTSNGSGASCPTSARVATGARPHMITAASPAAMPAPAPWPCAEAGAGRAGPAPAGVERAGLLAGAGLAGEGLLAVMGLLSCNGIVQFNTYITAGALIAAGLVNAAATDLASLSAVLRE